MANRIPSHLAGDTLYRKATAPISSLRNQDKPSLELSTNISTFSQLEEAKTPERMRLRRSSRQTTSQEADEASAMAKVLVYVVYHDTKSKTIAKPFTEANPWTKLTFIRSSKFFESIFFRDVLPFEYDSWKDLDYVGMISYRVINICINNMTFWGEDIPTVISMAIRDAKER